MLRVVCNDDLYFLLPCPAAKYKAYNALRGMLQGGQIGDFAASPTLWTALQKMVNLHPRGDCDQWGFPLPEDYWLVADLVDHIDELNTVAPLPEVKGDSPLPAIPIKSGGDNYLDLFADLSNSFGCESAFLLTNRYGVDELNKIVTRSNELAKPHEQRKQEFLAEKHEEWIADNPDLFKMAMTNPAQLGVPRKL